MNKKEINSYNFFIASFRKAGEISIFEFLGFSLYKRVGNVYSLFGYVFKIGE